MTRPSVTTKTFELRAATEAKRPRRAAVGEVELDALEPAARLLVGEPRFLVIDHSGQIDLDPGQVHRQIQAVGPRVEARGEVEHEVAAELADGLLDELVDHLRAHDHRPGVGLAAGHLERGLHPVLAGQAPRVRVSEHRVGTVGLPGAVDGHPLRRV
jgi:hypothetical protein